MEEASAPAAAGECSPAITPHHVVEGRSGGGVPTVLIHGVGSDLGRWDAVAAALAPYGPVVRYDLRGHGASPRPPGPYTIDDFAADHMALMARLGIRRAHVAGFSLGGLIAQKVALDHPESVDRLVVISAVAGRTPEQREAVRKRLEAVEEGGPGLVADGGARWYTDRFRAEHPEVVRAHLDRFRGNDPAAYAAAFRVLATTDLVDELPGITAPTLVMTGSLDVGSPPAMAEAMHARIAGSRLLIVPGVKHAIFEEAPRTVADAVTGFLHPQPPGDA
ncbi:alpha/beta fold hydrolase [Streptomyces sp. NPDC050560]|uniref:alpha/beta fold hydrolase n=1 Tax=Streptomyces sp. NPDC050560 TaxID=3365630 RepID=UPI0037AA314E